MFFKAEQSCCLRLAYRVMFGVKALRDHIKTKYGISLQFILSIIPDNLLEEEESTLNILIKHRNIITIIR